MKRTVQILRIIAEELAEKAKSSLPNLRGGEIVTREWFEDAVYHRESVLNGKVFHVGYDFRERKVI